MKLRYVRVGSLIPTVTGGGSVACVVDIPGNNEQLAMAPSDGFWNWLTAFMGRLWLAVDVIGNGAEILASWHL